MGDLKRYDVLMARRKRRPMAAAARQPAFRPRAHAHARGAGLAAIGLLR
jgi:hypothetical protein